LDVLRLTQSFNGDKELETLGWPIPPRQLRVVVAKYKSPTELTISV
jgi:hypothetical protein